MHPFLISGLAKRINETFQDIYLLQCANMYINQYLAMGVFLPAFFHLNEEETELKNKLWKDTETLFVSSMDVPGELILRFVPMQLMTETNRLLTFPIFLENDNILRDLFDKWHLHDIFTINPSLLRSYLMNRLTDSKLDLSNSLRIGNRICDSEASNYIKYRLDLFPKGSNEFTKYSKEKYCVCCCSFFAKQTYELLLHHLKNDLVPFGFYRLKKWFLDSANDLYMFKK